MKSYLNLSLHILNGIRGLNLEGDSFPSEGLDEDLHSASLFVFWYLSEVKQVSVFYVWLKSACQPQCYIYPLEMTKLLIRLGLLRRHFHWIKNNESAWHALLLDQISQRASPVSYQDPGSGSFLSFLVARGESIELTELKIVWIRTPHERVKVLRSSSANCIQVNI